LLDGFDGLRGDELGEFINTEFVNDRFDVLVERLEWLEVLVYLYVEYLPYGF
jgi:hypothetical protein